MGKMSRIWHTIREMVQYSAIPGHKDGAVALYSMALAKPMKINGFDFANFKGKKGKMRVSIRHELDTTSPVAQYFIDNHLEDKAVALFDPAKFPGQRRLAEGRAPSAMSYASGLAAGNPDVLSKNGGEPLEGAIVDKLAKLFSPCPPEAGTKSWMRYDNSWGCQGSNP